MTDGAAVTVDKQGPIWIVTLCRPARRNAVDRATAELLATAFEEFEDDASAWVAVLSGGPGSFCAGADLKAVAEGSPNRLEPTGHGPMGPSRMMLSKPVIAAIEGHAVAGGLELALWCDLRVAAQDAVLGVFCRRWGVPLIDGGTVRLPRLIGLGRALDLILTGRPVGAEEALSMGLVNRVVPAGETLSAALELARSMAKFPQHCLRGDRASTYEQHGLSLQAAMANEWQHGRAALEHEARAGAERFLAGAGRHGRDVEPEFD